jgi:hypothetical protein
MWAQQRQRLPAPFSPTSAACGDDSALAWPWGLGQGFGPLVGRGGLCTDGFFSGLPMVGYFQQLTWDPGGRTGARLAFKRHRPSEFKIMKLSPFQVTNNQISRDVRGLFWGHMFVWSRVIVKVPMLQLEDELLKKGRGNVRCQGTNGPGPMGRLSKPIRVRFRDKMKSLFKEKRCINQIK